MQQTSPASRRDTIIVLDYGSQYSQLITRRVRECQVYCEMVPWDIAPADLDALNPKGLILSGGPNSVYDEGAPSLPDQFDKATSFVSALHPFRCSGVVLRRRCIRRDRP